jgi:hypothetical protein
VYALGRGSELDILLNDCLRSMSVGEVMQLSVDRNLEPDIGYGGSEKYAPHTEAVTHHESVLEQSKYVYPVPYGSHANIKRCLKRRIRQRSLPLIIRTQHRKILIERLPDP